MAEKNPLVFMDISIDGVPVGSMTFELFKKVAPCAAENFRALCTGERGIGKSYVGLPLHYKGSFFLDMWKGGSYLKGGDFCSPFGRTGESIYNGDIPDEKPVLKCDKKGLLAMNMFDWYSLGSHFVITLKPDEELDRFHIVFGKIVKGLKTLDAIKKAHVENRVQVSECGECNEDGSKRYGRPQRSKTKKRAEMCSGGTKAVKARMC